MRFWPLFTKEVSKKHLPVKYVWKCFKKCGCSISGQCNYCDAEDYEGYDYYNSGRAPQYTLISSNQIAPNTTSLTCSSSDVEIQVGF